MKKIISNFNIRRILVVFLDLTIAIVSCFISYSFFKDLGYLSKNIYKYLSITTALTLLIFWKFKLYNSLWKYVGITELTKTVLAVTLITLINIIICLFTINDGIGYIPFRAIVVTGILQMLLTIFERFIYRMISNIANESDRFFHKNKERVMLIGAGDAGISLVNEMRNPALSNLYPVCFIDDNKNKIGNYIENVKVVGNRYSIVYFANKYKIDKIIIAMPSINPRELSEIIKICQETKCKVQTIPGIYQLINETATLSNLRNVDIKDLLGREQIVVNLEEINGYLKDQVILVTGAGGSIGSELCRQIVKSNPKQLIILDIYENNAYDIEQELRSKYKDINLVVLIASVRDSNKIDDIFNIYRPNIVIHAAAHKHVPLMETSPNEAVKNNVFGTLNVAKASDKYNVKRFILISTDKAVNPTNVMGATKRICEMIIQTINKHSTTEFVAVRFGNVLGSNGSVIPLFKKQIENGGPVTVTDERIIRFFMTIPEAVSLVLQAGSYAKGGEIFVLDMGEPVRIYDLAVNLIRLSGYTPNVDIKIQITGLRPGEKLYEEILMEEEGLVDTPNKRIHIGKPIDLDENIFFKQLDELYKVAYEENKDIKDLIKQIVSTYTFTK